LKALFKKAERRAALFAILVGEEELKKQVVTIKNMRTKEQSEVALEDFDRVAEQIVEEEITSIGEAR
ncbi:MAG: His/Gly/Thr/Pro-type tRNA ligase C-terminal domain-containing protein, partial [Bacilli bacterium]